MRRLVLPLSLFILMALSSCNLNVLDQGVADSGSSQPSENLPSRDIPFSTEAPSNVSATESYYQDRIMISWNEVPGADYYTLERAEVQRVGDALNWVEILDIATGSRYTDSDRNLKGGVYYAYRVTAHSTSGMLSGTPSQACYGSLLSPPADLEASMGTSFDAVTINWKQVPGASSYSIYKARTEESAGMGTPVGTVSQQSSPAGDDVDVQLSYEYIAAEDEKGSELYFVIRTNGPLGTSSDNSLVRTGYTMVVGAAETPEVSAITQGDSVDSVTLSWAVDPSDSAEDPISYTVRRSSPGSAETTIYPLYTGHALDKDENGDWTITDTDVNPNIEYTYSIIATNSIGRSPAATASGYLLSAPRSLTFAADTASRCYAVSEFTGALGSDAAGHEGWTYDVSVTTQAGETVSKGRLTYDEILAYRAAVADSVSSPGFEKEERTMSLRTVNGDIVSKESLEVVIGGVPELPVNVQASCNLYSADSANSEGVLPVYVTWEQPGQYSAHHYAVSGNGTGFYTTSELTNVSDSSVSLGKTYTYRVEAFDPFGRTMGAVTSTSGYGAITGQVFKHIFESNILKPWESPDEHPDYVSGDKSAIYGFVRQQGLGSLGSATTRGLDISVDGALHSGTISYHAKQEGVGGLVTFTYTRYYSEAADYLFYIDGNYSYQMNVTLSGSGSVSAPSDFVTGGLYPATVSFRNLSVSGNAFQGNYVITQHHSNGDIQYEVASR